LSRCARSTLDDLAGVIHRGPVERALTGISNAAKGEPAWPPLALFKATLLSVWYDLSDVKLAEAVDDQASFRCFCGFSSSEPMPERAAFVRPCKALVERQLDNKVLFDEITVQLKARTIRTKAGTLVDATIIVSASEEDDETH
jgi:IS5 family transposase